MTTFWTKEGAFQPVEYKDEKSLEAVIVAHQLELISGATSKTPKGSQS